MFDNKDLDSGDYLFNPTVLLKQTESKGIKTNSPHSFKYTPLGAVSYKDEGNRKSTLTASKINGKTVYTKGLNVWIWNRQVGLKVGKEY